jgi:ferredoxin
VELCPDVFTFNDAAEKAEVAKEEGGPEDCIEEAISSCPVECIKWEED